jgi:NAD(P)-dependent dehydrogenase (short-subunit alcohol dehydrogenase family)
VGTGRIEGKRAIVTGAGSGIGRATAIRFAQEGARVGLIDIDSAALEESVAVIAKAGGDGLALVADVTQEEQVAHAVRRAAEAFGGLDVVVSNAGVELIGQDGRVHEIEQAIWDKTIAINLTGMFLICKYGVAELLKASGGSVICTASPTGFVGQGGGITAYSASKGGVHALIRVMAHDYAADNIRVNGVVPGFTDTAMTGWVKQDAAFEEQLVSGIPLKRAGRPEEVAAMMLFLASDESAYATGAYFFIDGGMTAV